MSRWRPTHILSRNACSPLKVRLISPMGVGNASKDTLQGVVYWMVETSPRYTSKTGVHIILRVPETRLKSI